MTPRKFRDKYAPIIDKIRSAPAGTEVKCWCGEKFVKVRANHLYHSNACRERWWDSLKTLKRLEGLCLWCRKPYNRNDRLGQPERKRKNSFCSDKCEQEYWADRNRKKNAARDLRKAQGRVEKNWKDGQNRGDLAERFMAFCPRCEQYHEVRGIKIPHFTKQRVYCPECRKIAQNGTSYISPYRIGY